MAIIKRKKNMDMVNISIRKTTYMKLYLKADEKNVNFSDLIEELLQK